ncbi:hypothetical protein FA95DRAFT_1576811 [Auriscalpium vulgare]|uniref:Uncharacterized protein n=1 Tax=Auriscalpium vulgare TaxID=40419 RepID=A0ACB8R9B8_9AGAM|nr:hypothetical protein FA95DRAFT_1576811 [Auriscalpium vulgare]
MTINELRLYVLSVEWERALAFYGAVFGEPEFNMFVMQGSVGFSTMPTKLNAPAEKYNGNPWTTTSPSSKRVARAKLEITGLDSMPRKTFFAGDKISVWDISSRYRGPPPKDARESPQQVMRGFPSYAEKWEGEIPHDSLVTVFHTASTYGASPPNLSFNIQGVLILALPLSDVGVGSTKSGRRK